MFNLEISQSSSCVPHNILNWVISKMVWVKLWHWNYMTYIIQTNTIFYGFYALHSLDSFIAANSQIIIVKIKQYLKKINDRPILTQKVVVST